MDGFERRKEQSKEEIRHAAEELFSRFGADRVSINDIARKAGVSQATIYNNFGSKDALVKDYQHTIIRVLATRFRSILVWKKSWAQKLLGAIQYWLDTADEYKLAIENRSPSDSEAADVRDEIENAFKEFLKQGRMQGNLRSDIPDEAIISYIRLFQQSIVNDQ
ncbi:MAG TPA: TetR/AcrR family transcriptional regulator, partial [Dehalococcoidales bacterium]|nr:TetR/AcrR family transcriptional regulator [Dehalococcoidales bacterium]